MTDRQTKILEIVNQKKKVEVATLSQMLEVSQVTIRKDLDALEELNFLTREHGYATMKNMSDISNRMAFCYETNAAHTIKDNLYKHYLLHKILYSSYFLTNNQNHRFNAIVK